jgi:ribosomal protein S18 acetylase RimI-like enzyme
VSASRPDTDVTVRDLLPGDLDDVARIDSVHTGRMGGEDWERTLRRFVGGDRADTSVGLAATEGDEVVGYLLGEIRAFEFGSDPCGWVFAVGVESHHLRAGVASRLLAEASRRFAGAGITTMRTMVRRNDVPMQSFFRSAGFVGGSFVQLETEIEEGS